MSARLPGPASLGAQLRFARALQHEPHRALLELARTYGPVAQFGFSRYTYVLVSGVEANEHVLVTNASNFGGRRPSGRSSPSTGRPRWS